MKRYELNTDLAFEHFCKTINNCNELSRNLFEILNLKKTGLFFTFLPTEIDIQHIHNFTLGGMTKNARDTTINFLMDKLLSNKNYCLVFDDVLESYEDLSGYDLFETNGIHYKSEAYYLLNSKELIDSNLVRKCLQASDAEWHCLGILSPIDLNKSEVKTMTLEMIHNICRQADLIVTTAYDGEGYIFWERIK